MSKCRSSCLVISANLKLQQERLYLHVHSYTLLIPESELEIPVTAIYFEIKASSRKTECDNISGFGGVKIFSNVNDSEVFMLCFAILSFYSEGMTVNSFSEFKTPHERWLMIESCWHLITNGWTTEPVSKLVQMTDWVASILYRVCDWNYKSGSGNRNYRML